MKINPFGKTLVALATSVALLAGAGAAIAGGEDPGAWKIGGGGIWVPPDGSRHLADGTGGEFWIGRVINKHWDWDVSYFTTAHDVNGTAGHTNMDGVGIDFDRVYKRDSGISPFFTLGAGYVFEDSGPGYDDITFAKVGVGLLMDLLTFNGGGKLQLKTDAAVRYEFGSTRIDPVIGVGLQLAWGGRAPVVAAIAPPPPPPPLPPPPPPPPPVVLDGDGDGVPDARDLCLNTPRGERVGVNGCSCDVTVSLNFKNNSAELTEADKVDLDRVATNLTRLGFVSGTVVGHTDSVGSDAYNQALSERRAQTVARYLESKGIAAGRIKASGAGESQPIADNATEEGRAQNRRVVLSRTDCGP